MPEKNKTADLPVSPEMEREATQKATERARIARWDLNMAIFLFAVLILVIILVNYTKAGPEIVAPIAAFGLTMVWVEGRRREKKLYEKFYKEEIASQAQEGQKIIRAAIKDAVEETIEAQVQKALRERWR
jgi:hypothetical protein